MSYTVGRGSEPPTSGLDKPGEKLSLGVAARLSRYLQVLTQARKIGKETISSQELADYTHVNSTQIRRDLSGFGKFGKRGVGYNVESLVSQIRKILRTAGQHNIALFGAGHLGTAIATSDIFADHGFRVVAIFDVDPERVGTEIGTLKVRHKADLVTVVVAVPELFAAAVEHNLPLGFHVDRLLPAPAVWQAEQRAAGIAGLDPYWAVLRLAPLLGCALLWSVASVVFNASASSEPLSTALRRPAASYPSV